MTQKIIFTTILNSIGKNKIFKQTAFTIYNYVNQS